MKNTPPMTRILIAEPDEGLRILLTEELLEEGYDVIPVPPEALWERLRTERPHLVLMGLGDRDRLRRQGLQPEGLPVLVYGRSPVEPLGGWDPKTSGAATTELDLKEIKAKVRELLEGWGSSGPPPAGISNEPYPNLPQDQMHFDFSGGDGG